MGTQSTELTGPDLTLGVELSELTDDQPLLGHAGGQACILVRRGDRVFATGATCTHYSGPLADGLVVDGTIRCPWHHARFSLETGEAIGAPALSPIACYSIVRRGTKVSVGERKEPPRRTLDASSVPSSVVIVGQGAAGAAAVEALRREGYQGPIVFVGDEAPGPVDRPNLSKDYLAGTAPEEWIPLRNADFYRELGVEFLPDDPAERVDTRARRVLLKSGRAVEYGALLFATGAHPRKLSVPGADLPHVHVLRTFADSRAIIAALEGKRRVAVIGSSFIGLEVAASLRQRGLDVEVAGPDRVPLARVVGEEIGRFVQKLHEEHGVRFLLGTKPKKITVRSVILDDGAELDADLVVAGIGVEPRTELAQAAGVAVDGGIVVDRELRTNVPGVYAAGDVARYPDPLSGEPVRVEHWVHAERQGQAAARSILGRGGGFTDAPFFWSQHYDVTLSYVGHATSWDRIETRGSLDARDFSAAFVRNDRVAALLTVGRDRLSLRCEALLEAGDSEGLSRTLADS